MEVSEALGKVVRRYSEVVGVGLGRRLGGGSQVGWARTNKAQPHQIQSLAIEHKGFLFSATKSNNPITELTQGKGMKVNQSVQASKMKSNRTSHNFTSTLSILALGNKSTKLCFCRRALRP